MKNLFTILLLCCSFSLTAQLRLNVRGDAKITGQLDLSSSGSNMFIGVDTGESTTTGTANTIIGQAAGAFNSEGGSNTFLGVLSGFSNTSGDENTFIGMTAGFSNLTGSFNTFIGNDAGRNTNGPNAAWNTFVGVSSGRSNTTGQNNVFVGYSAGSGNTTGIGNTIVGNRTGNHSGFTSSFNALLGNQAGSFITSGDRNTFLGTSAGYNNTEGQRNTFVGISTGSNNTTGSFNTFVGSDAGDNNTTGSNLTAFGNNVNALLAGNGPINDAFAVGSNSIMIQSHSGVLGNISTQRVGGYVNWGTASDGRMKKAVKEDIKGLDFILQLRPVSYQVDALKLDQFLRQGMEEIPAGKEDLSATEKAQTRERQQIYEGYLREKSAIRYTGFIAQEVEKAMGESGFAFSGLVKPAHNKDHYSLRYAEFVVPLVKGVQELADQVGGQQELIEEQEKENRKQQQKIKELQAEVTELKDLVNRLLVAQGGGTSIESFELDPGPAARLSQNYPNPFHQDTTIDYFIPGSVRSARLELHTVDGRLLATFPIQQTGKGRVNIKASTYPAGTYLYSLVLDGEEMETKRMVLTK